MTIVDANLLVYANNTDAAEHAAASQWLAQLHDSGETVGLPWVSLWAFLRIATNPKIWSVPFSAPEVFAMFREWLEQPGVMIPEPGPRHAEILERLMTEYGVSGPKLTDAVLAALAIEYGARLASTDQDFRRFPELRWINPLRAPSS